MIDRHEGIGQAGKDRVERGACGGRFGGLSQRQRRRPQQGYDEPAFLRCRISGQEGREPLGRATKPVVYRDDHQDSGEWLVRGKYAASQPGGKQPYLIRADGFRIFDPEQGTERNPGRMVGFDFAAKKVQHCGIGIQQG